MMDHAGEGAAGRGAPNAQLRLWINGEERTLPAPTTVAGLIETLRLRPQQVAVERNLQLVPRAAHAATELRDGDRLEIVTFLGGG